MTSRINISLAATFVAVLLAGAVTAIFAAQGEAQTGPSKVIRYSEPGSTGYVPGAARVTIPSRLARLQEPGSTGYVPQTTHISIPSALAHFREPGSAGFVPVATVSAPVGGGFDWFSALIGAGAALGIALASAGALLGLRKRRTLAHV